MISEAGPIPNEMGCPRYVRVLLFGDRGPDSRNVSNVPEPRSSRSAMLPSQSRKAAVGIFQVGRNLSDWLSWELYSEALDQLRDTTGIHLKFITTTKLTESLRLRLCYSSEVNEFPEEILETGGRDDF
jgi:hypothetical protein